MSLRSPSFRGGASPTQATFGLVPDVSVEDEINVRRVDSRVRNGTGHEVIRSMLATCDVLTLHVPLTDDTRHLVAAGEIAVCACVA